MRRILGVIMVLMLAIPAKVAGCKEIILCTPMNKQGKVAPAVLSAAMVVRPVVPFFTFMVPA